MATQAAVIKYPGSKWRLADWIISQMPPHEVYLEPYFGSGAVFFRKQPARIETINDRDGDVINLFRVVRERTEELAALLEMTPWARDEYYGCFDGSDLKRTGDPLEDARRFVVRCWQAMAAATSAKTGWCKDVTNNKNVNYVTRWNRLPARVLHAGARLKQAQIENRPALDVIEQYRRPEVCIYADPPYVLEARRGEMYAVEMTDKEHIEMLEALDNHPGPVLLSGYVNEIYDKCLKHWTRRQTRALSVQGQIRTEALWLNPVASAGAAQKTLFDGSG